MDNIAKSHTLICNDMKVLNITGVQKVESSTKTQFVCDLNGKTIVVCGKNLHIKKLDLQTGVVEIEGEIDSIKYQSGKKSFWKRIFK